MDGPRGRWVLEMTVRLDAPRERVFRALTEPTALAQWWGPGASRRPRSSSTSASAAVIASPCNHPTGSCSTSQASSSRSTRRAASPTPSAGKNPIPMTRRRSSGCLSTPSARRTEVSLWQGEFATEARLDAPQERLDGQLREAAGTHRARRRSGARGLDVREQGRAASDAGRAAAPSRRTRGILEAGERRQPADPVPGRADTTSPDLEHHSGAVERARADLAAGRAWKARDRLAGHLADSPDPEALEPRGGALRHGRHARRRGGLVRHGPAWKDVDEAIEAWRERHADHLSRRGAACRAPSRDAPGNPRRCAAPAGRRRPLAGHPRDQCPVETGGGLDPAVVITVVLAVLFVICAIVGAVTLLRWIIPG